MWADRSKAEIEECRRHEALLNLALADAEGFWLRCPYDRSALDPQIVADACCTHPELSEAGTSRESEFYPGEDDVSPAFAGELSPPGPGAVELGFCASDLKAVRRFADRHAQAAGLNPRRAGDSALALNELAANSIRHAGGEGVARAWRDNGELIFEVEDKGTIEDPLAGRRKPGVEQTSGRGLSIVSQVTDLLEIRSGGPGTVARIHMHVG